MSWEKWQFVWDKGKVKIHNKTVYEGPEGSSRWGGWLTSRPDRFTLGKHQVPFLQEAEWVSVQVWTDAENLTITGIRSPTVHPVASRYTDWAIQADCLY